MSEHTHLSGIDVSKDGAIHFSFATHEDHPQHGIAGMSVPVNHDAQHVASQLQMLAALGAMHPEHAKAAVAKPGMENVQALYTPDPKQPKPQQHQHAQHQVHGQHTANYLNQMSAEPLQGQAI